ncbi:hypothetical protein [Streptosporangium sp. NPDC051022]|uniref:hypothetical protein n=1 Tax=Streptosporangium sp. NPDC051022 TaxID=3155752 RepID=UPI00342B833E
MNVETPLAAAARRAEELARSLTELAAFVRSDAVRTNPRLLNTLRVNFGQQDIPIGVCDDAHWVLRDVSRAADAYGLPVYAALPQEQDGRTFRGLRVVCGVIDLRVCASQERLSRPIGDYLPEVAS